MVVFNVLSCILSRIEIDYEVFSSTGIKTVSLVRYKNLYMRVHRRQITGTVLDINLVKMQHVPTVHTGAFQR